MDTSLVPLLGNRYRLEKQIGAGGMGAVFRAYDRLRGADVALKRVLTRAENLIFASRSAQSSPSLALANEFQALSSLRHPNIISVLDYGFDPDGNPYFTMELLEGSENILTATRNLSLAGKVGLLSQVLSALVYLHRHGILHRDLKPDNVLVFGGRVRVVDFGLAVAQAHSGMSGTLSYMSPEVLMGQAATPAADLYAVGVMAYLIFGGKLPFIDSNILGLMHLIIHEPPDLSILTCPPPLVRFIDGLLSKSPAGRGDALQALAALHHAAGLPAPRESGEQRESFLQAARFVGREPELRQLREALGATLDGKGSAWLIGGESGVGKSRLMDELRAWALVQGVVVLSGVASEGVSLPYTIWRDPLRRLALSVPLSDLEAGILKPLVPDMAALLGRPIPDAPELESRAAQARLVQMITAIFRRAAHPILLLVDDLQWAEESLLPLRPLAALAPERPLLIVGSYRDDERPDLPGRLPNFHLMKLGRLSGTGIADLAKAMLGPAHAVGEVTEMLQRETEGNIFFMVEVMRALAEESGGLEQVGMVTLPRQVFAGGIQRIVQRRLEHVPPDSRHMLRLAAVAGRTLDPTLIRTLDPEIDLDRWLQACSNAAVLEVRENVWRFSHDKLREWLYNNLTPRERAALHGQVALALETLYPNQPDHAMTIAEHWQVSGYPRKVLHHTPMAAKEALRLGNYADAARIAGRGLQALPADAPGRLELIDLYAVANQRLNNQPEAIRAYDEGLALAEKLDSTASIANILTHRAVMDWEQGHYQEGLARMGRALPLAETCPALEIRIRANTTMANLLWYTGEYARAHDFYRKALEYAQQVSDPGHEGTALNNLALVEQENGDLHEARRLLERSLELKKRVGNLRSIGIAYENLGAVASDLEEWAAALDYYRQALEVMNQIADPIGIATVHNEVAMTAYKLGDLETAYPHAELSLAMRIKSGEKPGQIATLCTLGFLSIASADFAKARDHFRAALELAQTIGALPRALLALIGFARLYALRDQFTEAAELLSLIEAHPALTRQIRKEYAAPLARTLGARLSPEAFRAAYERGKTLDLTAMTIRLLGDL